MATYYISWDTGNDTTGDGSLATPWKSLTKCLAGATPALASGDVLIMAPGVYREVITIGLAPDAETIIRGDPLNTSGFAGVEKGPVVLSGYTTNDATAYAAANLVSATSKDYFTWENIWFLSGRTCLLLITSENWTVRNCLLQSNTSHSCVGNTPAVDTANNLLLDNCIIQQFGSGPCVYITDCPTSDVADYDLNIVIRNCLLEQGGADILSVYIDATGAGAYFAGGVIARNCNINGRYAFRTVTASKLSTTIPCGIYNSIVFGQFGIHAATPGQIVEDYNLILAASARSNVTAGGNSQTTARAPYLELGQSQLWGLPPLPPFSPWSLSRTLGFGGSSPPTTDMLGRPRPSGPGPVVGNALAGIGAMDYHDFGTTDTSVKDAGDASIKLIGPGDHELLIPVNTNSTTVSIKVRRDSASYDLGTRPSAVLVDKENFANITGNTETKTGSAACDDAWETLTFTPFTPSRKGAVRIWLVNASSAGDGVCWFDTLNIE